MPNVLNNIIKDTQVAVEKRKRHDDYLDIPAATENDIFYNAILRAPVPAVIAEIKMKSPSHGEFISELSLEERVMLYEHAEATAISYVSNETYFGGNPSTVTKIKTISSLPVLQKDFVVDEYQIHEAVFYKADALLLIARIVDVVKLRSFVAKCQHLHIEPVVEIYDEDDLRKALDTTARVIGVNSRNLDTLEMDMDKACRIIKKVPSDKVVIAFSGVNSKEDVTKYVDAGARGVLVGSSFMNAQDITRFMNQIR